MQRSSSAVRSLSTKIQRTPEQIKEGLAKAEKFKNFIRPSAGPKSLTDSLGSGKELHIPQNISELAVLNGMPAEHSKRTVVVTQRFLKTVQSGGKYADQWQIYWKNESTDRWSNPLMGWTSTADPLSNVKLNFDTKEEAVAFAQRNGWAVEVNEPTSKRTIPTGTYLYKHNFLAKRTTDQMAKEGARAAIWASPGYGESHFFMPLKYHGDGEVAQHGPSPKTEK